MPINTVFQLIADEGAAALAAAERIALVPDLLALWLTGELRQRGDERLDHRPAGRAQRRRGRATWSAGSGCRTRRSPATRSSPARTIGPVLGHHAGVAGLPLHAVASHDTASAFVAAPLRSPTRRDALVGHLVAARPRARRAGADRPRRASFNLTNERGIDGTIRLLRNVMGLWLLQECRRQLGRSTTTSCTGSPPPRDPTSRCSTPTTTSS